MGALISPHPQGPQPSALGDFSLPTAEAGRAIPYVCGTVLIKGGNTTWWGDLKTKAVKVGGGILELGRTTTTGYKYFIGVQFMLCRGAVDELIAIEADQKDVQYTATVIGNEDGGGGSENYIELDCDSPNLYGGTVAGGAGGIEGTINFYRGLQTQQPDAYLSAKQGRIGLDQSGLLYAFTGVGNGGMTDISGGSNSVDETITMTAVGIDGNNTHSTFGKMKFSVVGSTSGTQHNSTLNTDGSSSCWADEAFSCPRINFTILTGPTQYQVGDQFVLTTQHAFLAPAFRGLCYAVLKQLYVGTSNYPKPMGFIVRRCPDPLALGSSIANINGDANGACVIYDLLTDPDCGLAVAPAAIDPVSFTYAAGVLATEGLGISMQFDTQGTADQLFSEVLRHVDGVVYVDPATGLWTIKLARADYDASTLPTLTVDNVVSVTPDFSRGSWSETTNLVCIRYTSRDANFTDSIQPAYDPANILVTSETRPQTIDFKGISTDTAASLVAMRCLKTFTYPLAKMKIVADRTAWKFRPCGVFRFTWVPLGIINQVMRITRIDYGELTDGKISLDVVEDIFGINSVAFVPPPESGWVNPLGAPLANADEQLVEVPLHIQKVDAIPVGIYAMAMAARNPTIAAKSFEVWRDDGGGFFDTENAGSFCPYGQLAAAYPVATVANDPVGFTLAVSGAVDLEILESVTAMDLLQGKLLAIIDDQEIVSVETVSQNADGTWSVAGVLRGIMDTVPANHAIGAAVYFFSVGVTLVNSTPYLTDRTVTAKLLPMNDLGSLPITSATARTVTTHSRNSAPYPAGNLRMQGAPYGTRYKTIVGDLVLTFSCRNAALEAGVTPLTLQDANDDTAPASGEFTIYKFLAGSPVGSMATATPPSASFTYAASARMADGGPGLSTVKVFGAVTSPSLVESLQAQQVDVTFTGFGFLFGEYFGGLQS